MCDRNSKRQRVMHDMSDEDEQIAKEHDTLVASNNAGTTGAGMNASLNQRYMANSKKAEKVKKALRKAKDTSSSEASSSASGDFLVSRPTNRYADFGGIDSILKDVRELIEYQLLHPEIYLHLGIEPPRGVLLHGPPGCGKTMLANAIAGESGASFLKVSAPEIVSGMSGESEQKLRSLFTQAIANAPSIIFVDEIDAITPKRETSQRGMEKRIVAQLLTCMDSLSLDHTGGKAVVVIGATNRPDALDPALRRAGRFDREICLGIPDQASRERILHVMCQHMRLAGDFDLHSIAARTPGFVGADLKSLAKEAAVVAVNRIFTSKDLLAAQDDSKNDDDDGSHDNNNHHPLRITIPLTAAQLEPLSICMQDFEQALPHVQPSSKREGFATIPGVSWDQIGALENVRHEMKMSILDPIRFPGRYEALGLTMPAGVLLYGPPGCGKTLVAKAVANESLANFISIKGPELLDKYVGESERAVRQVFQRARASAPCIIFFDELDALCPKRGQDSGGAGVSERVVNQLLTEMDGLESRSKIFVIAATNRPDMIDSAMLRPGRLDKLLYVPLPVVSDRISILQTLAGKTKVDPSVKMDLVAQDRRCDGFSGADLEALVRQAGMEAMTEYSASPDLAEMYIQSRHFDRALDVVCPSVSVSEQRVYDRMSGKLRKSRRTKQQPKDEEEETPCPES